MVAILMVVLLISFMKVAEQSTKVQNAQSDFQAFKTQAQYFNQLQDANSQSVFDEFLKKIANNKEYQQAMLKINQKNKNVELSFEGEKHEVYGKLINEILNTSFVIQSLDIKKSQITIELLQP